MTAPTCHYCEKPAVALCDHLTRIGLAFHACDRPICADHRKKVGNICDRSRRTTNNLSDTIDWCAEHEKGA